MIRKFTHYVIGLAICIASIQTTQAQKIYTAVGGLKDGGPATAAQLFTPTGLSIDADDNLYLSEVDSYVIRKVDAATGTITTIAGHQVKWIGGDNGPALSASLASPVSVAVHPVTGDVYSVDQLYHFVRRIDETDGNIYRVAGDGGVPSFSGDGLEAIHGRFASPQGIAIAANGDIYIADASNQRIRKINGTTGIISTVAGTGETGFSGDGGPATDGMLNFPTAVAVDEDNNFYIHDQGSYRIRRVDATTGNISTIAGDGTNGFTGDGGDAVDARISNVGGIVVRGEALYFTDQGNFRIRKIDFASGDISTIVGTGENGYGGDDNDPLLAKIGFSSSLVFDSHGDLIFADFGNNRIRKVSGGVITTIVGHGFFYGDGGPADKASIMDPADVAFDEDGNMYIADQGNFRIRKVNSSLVISTIAGDGTNNRGGEGVDAATVTVGNVVALEAYDGALYFLEDCRVRKLDLTTNLVTTVAGSASCGFSGDGGQAAAAELWPVDFAVSSDGIMFISDPYNARIRRVDLSTGIITTLVGDGTNNYSGDGGQAANAQINYPMFIDVDPTGDNLYFADLSNNAIRKVDLTTGIITTIAGTGLNGGVNLPALATSAMLSNPIGVLALANGNLLIVQGTLVMELDQRDGILRSFAGTGSSGASGDGGLAVSATITAPLRLVQQANGDIYIADAGSERIRKIVLPQSQTITFELPSPVIFGSEDMELEATASSGLSVYFESSNTDVAEIINSTTLKIKGAGTVEITARQDGNADFARASTKQTLVVNKATQIISFEYIDEIIANEEPPALEATSTSGLTVLLSSSNEDVATLEGSILTIIGVGTTTITANQAGNSSYEPAEAIEQILVVIKADQAITFDLLSIKNINEDDFDLAATTTSGLAVSYSSSNLEVATVSGTTVSIVGMGNTTITANQAGNSIFNAAEPIEQILVIEKDSQEIEFATLPEKIFKDDPFDLTATSSSELPVTFASSDPAVATISGATVTITGAGTTTITASQPGNAIYYPAEKMQVLTVNKSEQEITFAPLLSRQFNDDDFDLLATSSSDLSVSYQSSDPTVATVSGATVSIVGVGTTTITASQSGNANYNAALQVEQALIIQKDDQEITFLTLSGKTFGDDAFDLTATASSELPVILTSSETGVATVNGATITIVGAGTTTITASQEGNDSYNAAVSITRTLEVAKAVQVITFSAVNKTLGDAPFALEATSTSGLAVSFSSTSDKLTINSNTVTLVKAGRAIVLASQEGNDNYEAAEAVEQSFCINPSKPAITAGAPGEEVTLTSSNDDGNQWYVDQEEISDATAKTYITAQPGSYVVQTTIDDCASTPSESFVLIVTGISARSESGMKIYPNPSSDFVMVEVKTAQREELSLEVFDAVGRLVQSRSGSTNTAEQLDLSTYGAGMYRIIARAASARYSGSVLKK